MENGKAEGFFVMRTELYTAGLEDLIDYVNAITPVSQMKILEIGSYIGESTLQFARRFGMVVSIDPFLDDYDVTDPACHCWPFSMVYDEFLKNTMIYSNIKSIRLKSTEAVNVLKHQQWDMVYIDGCHTYEAVKEDIENYRPLIKPGGFIAGHDYFECGTFGVKTAVDDNFKPDMVFNDTSWVVRV